MHCIKVVKVILSSLFTFFNLFSKLVKKATGPCVLTILEVSDVNANLVIMARRKTVKIWMSAPQTNTTAVLMLVAIMMMDLTVVHAIRVIVVTVEIART